jgi:hypothetical protein
MTRTSTRSCPAVRSRVGMGGAPGPALPAGDSAGDDARSPARPRRWRRSARTFGRKATADAVGRRDLGGRAQAMRAGVRVGGERRGRAVRVAWRIAAGRPARQGVSRGELLYVPWRHGDGPVLLFRDHDLSDPIGFAMRRVHRKTRRAISSGACCSFETLPATARLRRQRDPGR